MIRCEVTRSFTLEKYKELTNVVKVGTRKENEFGKDDTFECTEEMAKYLTGNNANGDVVVKIIEVIPDEQEKKEVDTKQIAKSIINATKVIKTTSKLKKTTKNEKK